MPTEEKPKGQCFNCGAETTYRDYLGHRLVWVCDAAECEREMRDACGEADAMARERAEEDGFSRYA